MNPTPRYPELLDACRHLFGDSHLSTDFLYRLKAEGIKSAYRRKAKENHPDLFSHAPQPVRQAKEELFRRTHAAYEALIAFVGQKKEAPAPHRPATPKPAEPAVPPQPHKHRARKEGSYYTGTIPCRPLPLGRFLYYSGVISYQSLVEALTWQRTNRMTLGAIAKTWGWLSETDIRSIINDPEAGRFGEKAVRLKLLTALQVHAIVMHQRSRHLRFGRYFVMRNEITHGEMETFVHALRRHNLRFAGLPEEDEDAAE